jgi:PAS domain S-box-containing protein
MIEPVPTHSSVHTAEMATLHLTDGETGYSGGWMFAMRSRMARFGFAILLGLLGSALTVQFAWALDRNIFMVFLIATTVTSLMTGWVPGLLSLAIGAITFAGFLTEPYGSLAIASPAERARLAAFVIITTVVIALCEQLRRTSLRVSLHDEELRGRLRMLKTLLNSTPLAVIALDADKVVRLWNPAAERLFGWRSREIVGREYPLVPESLGREFSNVTNRVYSEGRSVSGVETRRLHKNGTEVEITLWVAPLRDGVGKVVGALGIAADAGEQRALESRLREAQKLEALGGLAGGVAHDFNNMLTAILSSAELGLMELPKDHPVAEDLTEIRKAALRAASLTRQLLAFGRRQVLQPRDIEIPQLIRDHTPRLQRILGPQALLITELQPDLPPTHADWEQLKRVLDSLAENARDAMPDGGELRISARRWSSTAARLRGAPAVAEGDYVLLTVADTGIGMDERTLSKLFEPFFTTKAFGTGAGLGLATVYGIVRQSGGYVWATSTPGKGSEFFVLLPTSAAPSGAREGSRTARTPSILLVDDDDALRALALRLLKRAGYRVYGCASGEEAIASCAEMPTAPDLLITDLVMPRMSGSRLAKELRERWPSLEVLYLSGFTESEAVSYGLQPGARFLAKPFTIESLLDTVASVLEDSRIAA